MKKSCFKIDAYNFSWINGAEDDPHDFCLHGDAAAVIGEETLSYHCTVSATALVLLKTLTENHEIKKENQMLPCCGFFMVPDDALANVTICGCPNGIDWSVIHENQAIRLLTEAGNETIVDIEDYKQEVFRFADKIESYYRSCTPKILPDDEFERQGYVTFWNEWHRRRGNKGV